MLVMKFGGTSLKDADRIRKAADIVIAAMDRKPVVVVSALGGVTDALQKLADAALHRGTGDVDDLTQLTHRHRRVLADLGLPPGCVDAVLEDLQAMS